MKLLFLITPLAALWLCACNITNSQSFEFNGDERVYELYTPPSLDRPSGKNKPLLLVLHGNPSSGWQQRMYCGMDAVARKGDFIVAYPSALTGKWPIKDGPDVDEEVGYIGAVLNDIVHHFPVDTSRIYISGISGGGIFSLILADRIPERIAAIGVVAGNLPTSFGIANSLSPTPVVLFHGTDDFLYNGRPDLYSVESTLAILGRINGCIDQTSSLMPDYSKKDATSVELISYTCESPLTFYKIHGGGHHWPGANFNASRFTKMELGNFCRDIDASQLIWDFVSKFRK